MEIENERTAIVILDYQHDILNGYAPDPAGLMQRADALLRAARGAGVTVLFVRAQFRAGYPEISDRNAMFCGVRDGNFLGAAAKGSQIPSTLIEADTDIILDKYRVGAFEGTALSTILRSRDVDTLILFGVSTSGCVLSTVRYGADLDYRLIVVEDLCADLDADVHQLLMQKLFPTQATVCRSTDILAAL